MVRGLVSGIVWGALVTGTVLFVLALTAPMPNGPVPQTPDPDMAARPGMAVPEAAAPEPMTIPEPPADGDGPSAEPEPEDVTTGQGGPAQGADTGVLARGPNDGDTGEAMRDAPTDPLSSDRVIPGVVPLADTRAPHDVQPAPLSETALAPYGDGPDAPQAPAAPEPAPIFPGSDADAGRVPEPQTPPATAIDLPEGSAFARPGMLARTDLPGEAPLPAPRAAPGTPAPAPPPPGAEAPGLTETAPAPAATIDGPQTMAPPADGGAAAPDATVEQPVLPSPEMRGPADPKAAGDAATGLPSGQATAPAVAAPVARGGDETALAAVPLTGPAPAARAGGDKSALATAAPTDAIPGMWEKGDVAAPTDPIPDTRQSGDETDPSAATPAEAAAAEYGGDKTPPVTASRTERAPEPRLGADEMAPAAVRQTQPDPVGAPGGTTPVNTATAREPGHGNGSAAPPALGLPESGFSLTVPGVRTGRLPTVADAPQRDQGAARAETGPQEAPGTEAPAAPEPGAPAEGALARYAMPFAAPGGVPLVSVILIDAGAKGLAHAALADLGFPVTVAVDPTRPDAPAQVAAYRKHGQEVVTLARGMPAGATPRDLEVTMTQYLDRTEGSVAVLDAQAGGFQDDRALAAQMVDIAADTGHGLVTYDRGLNSAARMAGQAGVPAVTVYRVLDGARDNRYAIRRKLDRALFEARRDGHVVLVGHTYPETVKALSLWVPEVAAEGVQLAPVSSLLR